jgi:hypothetical protein
LDGLSGRETNLKERRWAERKYSCDLADGSSVRALGDFHKVATKKGQP